MSEDKLKPIQVVIDNFQSIAHLDFEVRGFTCITGVSNIGKSAIVRAISGALLNDPVVNKVRRGKKLTSVKLGSEGWSLKWEKGPGTTRYWIPADAEKPIDKVGMGQVEPVAALGFQTVKIGNEWKEAWYATEWEPLFLLAETGSAVSDFISDVSRLQVLQDAIVLANKGKKKSVDEMKLRVEEADEIRDKLSRLVAFDHLQLVEKELREQSDSIVEYEKRHALGDKFLSRLEWSGKRVSVLSALDIIKRAATNPEVPDLLQKARVVARWNDTLRGHAKLLIAVKPVKT